MTEANWWDSYKAPPPDVPAEPSPDQGEWWLQYRDKPADTGVTPANLNYTGLGQSIKTGLIRGGEKTVGLPGDLANLINDYTGGGHFPVDTPAVANTVEGYTGPLYQPRTTAERYAEAGAEGVIPGMLGPARSVAGVAGNALRFGVLPGVAGEGAVDAARGMGVKDQYLPVVRAAMGLTTAAAAPRIITPLPASAEHVSDIRALRGEGVTPTAGQATDRPWLKYWESDLNPGRNEQQAQQVTAAAFNRVGMPDVTRATTEAVDGMMKTKGAQFDALAMRNTLDADPKLVSDIRAIERKYRVQPGQLNQPGLYSDETRGAVKAALERVSGSLLGAPIIGQRMRLTGADYQTLRSDLNSAAMGADGQKSKALRSVVNALDDAMERSIGRTNPDDLGAWQTARREYRNALVLQHAAATSTDGYLTRAQLASAAKQVYGEHAYATGKDDFSDLTKPLGSLKPLPDSGTSQRNRINRLLVAIGAGGGLGYGAAHLSGGAIDPVNGLLMGETLGPLVEPFVRAGARVGLNNPITQRYLSNQITGEVPGLLSSPQSVFLAGRGVQGQ